MSKTGGGSPAAPVFPAPDGPLIAAVFGTNSLALFSAPNAVASGSNLGGLMLNYFREAQEARSVMTRFDGKPSDR
jgi:hypothetical protein